MVVKIYIVTYDFSDMPPLTQTFLRQKTLSRPHHLAGQGATPTTYLPALHYLIHLRQVDILTAKWSIQMVVFLLLQVSLFQVEKYDCAPDTTGHDPDHSKVSLYTRTEVPINPDTVPPPSPPEPSVRAVVLALSFVGQVS